MLTGLLLAAAAAAAQPQPPKQFGNWVVGCDNGLGCRAVGFQAEGEDDFYSLSVFRAGQPNASPKVTLDVDGIVAGVGDGRRVPLYFDKNEELAAADVPALLALVLASRKLEFVNASGKVVARISPGGSSAALRLMDERQHRAGTVTALVAKGAKPESTVPAPPALPNVLVAAHSSKPPRKLSAATMAQIQKKYECSPADFQKPEFERLDVARTLALIPCNMGAYQSSGITVLVEDDGSWRAPTFVGTWHNIDGLPAGSFKAEELTEPEFDAKTNELWTVYRGRGLDDCGGMEGYAWDGARFRLVYQNLMDPCSGSRERITIWRTANHSDD